MNTYEINMDGLVGPTHHYVAPTLANGETTHEASTISNPAKAALQGIAKMRLMHQLGIKQGFFPPHRRPNLLLLQQFGFEGKPESMLRKAKKEAPYYLGASYSAGNMWAANAATVSPSRDTKDRKVHFTAANLINQLHRYHEAAGSHSLLQQIFADDTLFHHHPPLPAIEVTRDEGAANHIRLCASHQDVGTHLFVYNQQTRPLGNDTPLPQRTARQTKEASEAIVRSHQLNPKQVVFAQQNPAVVDQGIFHNDLIAMGNESLLLVHEDAFVNQPAILNQLRSLSQDALHIIEISRDEISIAEALESYLFNSQLVTLPNQTMALIAPLECQQTSASKTFIDSLIASSDNPIQAVHYLDLEQSMRSGGGPACLRLRVVLNEKELNAMHPAVMVDEALLIRLENWVKRYYRTELHEDDFEDPALMRESFEAMDCLEKMLKLKLL
jgi:succinylarginine dihydrolase